MISASDELRRTAERRAHTRTTLCVAVLSGSLIFLGSSPAVATTAPDGSEESSPPTTVIDASEPVDQEDADDQDDADEEDQGQATEPPATDEPTEQPATSEPLQSPGTSDEPVETTEAPGTPDTPAETPEPPTDEDEPSTPAPTPAPTPTPTPTPEPSQGTSPPPTAPGTPGTPPETPTTPTEEPEPEPEPEAPASLQCGSTTVSTGGTASVKVANSNGSTLQISGGSTGVFGGTAEISGNAIIYTAPHSVSGTGSDSFTVTDVSGNGGSCTVTFTVYGTGGEEPIGSDTPPAQPSPTSTDSSDYNVPGTPATATGSLSGTPTPAEEGTASASSPSAPGYTIPGSPHSTEDPSENSSSDEEDDEEDEDGLAETGADSTGTAAALILALGSILAGVAAVMISRRRA